MKAYQQLPEGYGEILQIDLQKDQRAALKVNAASAAVMIGLIILGHLIVPISAFVPVGSFGAFLGRMAVLLGSYLAYIILHELTHGAVMKAVGGGKVLFGFTGLYAFAGSREDYFDKTAHRCIALAPLTLWGIIFGILCFTVPRDLFWIFWFLEAGNIAGSAGDIYVTAVLWKMPDSLLVMDTGVAMSVYGRE